MESREFKRYCQNYDHSSRLTNLAKKKDDSGTIIAVNLMKNNDVKRSCFYECFWRGCFIEDATGIAQILEIKGNKFLVLRYSGNEIPMFFQYHIDGVLQYFRADHIWSNAVDEPVRRSNQLVQTSERQWIRLQDVIRKVVVFTSDTETLIKSLTIEKRLHKPSPPLNIAQFPKSLVYCCDFKMNVNCHTCMPLINSDQMDQFEIPRAVPRVPCGRP